MREKILKLFELTNANENMKDIMNLMLTGFQDAAGDDVHGDTIVAKIKELFEAEIPSLTENSIRQYIKTYSEEEIDAMIAWHSSPVGRKIEAMRKPLLIATHIETSVITERINVELLKFLATLKY